MVTSCVYTLQACQLKMADSKKILKGQQLNEEETGDRAMEPAGGTLQLHSQGLF